MALRSAAELRAIGVRTGLTDDAFQSIVTDVDGMIGAYITAHYPADQIQAVLDSYQARLVQLQLVRLVLTDTATREETVGDYRHSPRSLRFEQPRLLRQLGRVSRAFGSS